MKSHSKTSLHSLENSKRRLKVRVTVPLVEVQAFRGAKYRPLQVAILDYRQYEPSIDTDTDTDTDTSTTDTDTNTESVRETSGKAVEIVLYLK